MSVEELQLSVEDISENETETLTEEAEEDIEKLNNEKEARKIAQGGNYEAILEELKEKDLLYEQVDRISGYLSIDFMTDNDWEMLTVMELYDRGTFEHCVKTYKIAKDKVEKVLDGGIIIANIIEEEGVDLEVFYRACLFHDIGKIEIPEFILNNKFTDGDWTNSLCNIINKTEDDPFKEIAQNYIGVKKHQKIEEDELATLLEERKIRSMWLVPVKEVLTSKESIELEGLGFSSNDSLRKIIESHEEISERILKNSGLEIEAKLAGQHHNYKQKNTNILESPKTTTAMAISLNLADVLQLADIQQALESGSRFYKSSFSELRVLSELIGRAEGGYVDGYITYLWVKDSMEEFDSKKIKNKSDFERLDTINKFLKSYTK